MSKDRKTVVWFDEVGKADLSLAGGKGANLGEMTRAGIPVPPGFIVTAESYFYFLKKARLYRKIEAILQPLDPNNGYQLQETAERIKKLITDAPMPRDIASEIEKAYEQLGGLVAVRSSATAEDLPEASFAGQQRTLLNIQSARDVVAAVQACWASLFEPRAIFYRHEQHFDHLKVGIAVPVQRMVQSDSAGVIFTVDPNTGDDTIIIIEAVYGLGETVVSGGTTPDLYLMDKESLEILDKTVVTQDWKLVKSKQEGGVEGTNIMVHVAEEERQQQKIADEDIVALATIAKRIEELYGSPQDIEWAKEDKHLYIVQTRPVTALDQVKEMARVREIDRSLAILRGSPASPGIAAGLVKMVLDPSEISRVYNGAVLVAEMTTPDFVPAMKRASAIVTDRGGRTCHAAIVSRELGVPCVVGTEHATHTLSDDEMITVDGSRGLVFEGTLELEKLYLPTVVIGAELKTKTRVYVNLAEPGRAHEVASRNVDGVGLLRAEFMIAEIGEHPRYMLDQGRGEEFTAKLAEGITVFARAFYPRPVVYRTTDFKTNEYRNLKGGQDYEEQEENPMMGYRGASRYLRELDAFRLEIEAIKRVRRKHKNLWVMIPFVRTVEELAGVKQAMVAGGLHQSRNFRLWMMVEVPSNIFLLDRFLDVGIDGISIGSNDLTQFILGIDRDSSKLADEFDERNEAVELALQQAIEICKRRGVTSSICGQAPSVYPELTEKLVEWGITSVSVNPDAIERTREIIAAVEGKLEAGGKRGNRRAAS